MISFSKVTTGSGEKQQEGSPEVILANSAAQSLSKKIGREAEEEDSRIVARSLVDLEILYLLNFGPKSGYELRKNLFNSFHLNISYGTLYPHLHSLEKSELIIGTWKFQEDNTPLKKRMYSLTQRGSERLFRSIGSLSKIALTMQFLLAKLDLNPHKTKAAEAGGDAALKTAEIFFSARGYSVKRNATLRGSSGFEHMIELFASKLGTGIPAERVVVRIAGSESGVSIDDLYKIHVTSYDIQATRTIILSTPSAQEEVLKIADVYHIGVCEGKSLEEAVAKMCQQWDKD